MKSIGERITYSFEGKELVIFIDASIEKWKETLLMAWVFTWLVVGGLFIWQLSTLSFSEKETVFIWVFLAFWAYFLVRIGKTLLWRLFGREMIKIDGSKFLYKRDIKKYGKAHRYFLENIKAIDVSDTDRHAIGYQLSGSFWVIGGEKLELQASPRNLRFGMLLNKKEAGQLQHLIEKTVKAHQKIIHKKKKEHPDRNKS